MRGHIVKRGKSSYTIVLSLGVDPASGKRKQQWLSVKGTKKDAERRLAEVLHQVDTGGFVTPRKLTVGGFLRQWLQGYAATNVRSQTLQRYRGIIEGHFIPAFGNIPLAQLQPSHIQACHARALNEGRLDGRGKALTAKSVLQHHRVLSEALSHAVKWGLVARNVAKAVTLPPGPSIARCAHLTGTACTPS